MRSSPTVFASLLPSLCRLQSTIKRKIARNRIIFSWIEIRSFCMMCIASMLLWSPKSTPCILKKCCMQCVLFGPTRSTCSLPPPLELLTSDGSFTCSCLSARSLYTVNQSHTPGKATPSVTPLEARQIGHLVIRIMSVAIKSH